MSYGMDDVGASQAVSQGFQNQYGDPSNNLQNITKDPSASGPTDNIPIDNTIMHYELPNLTQRKFLERFLVALRLTHLQLVSHSAV